MKQMVPLEEYNKVKTQLTAIMKRHETFRHTILSNNNNFLNPNNNMPNLGNNPNISATMFNPIDISNFPRANNFPNTDIANKFNNLLISTSAIDIPIEPGIVFILFLFNKIKIHNLFCFDNLELQV